MRNTISREGNREITQKQLVELGGKARQTLRRQTGSQYCHRSTNQDTPTGVTSGLSSTQVNFNACFFLKVRFQKGNEQPKAADRIRNLERFIKFLSQPYQTHLFLQRADWACLGLLLTTNPHTYSHSLLERH
ncbi:hypothetical protein ElyMa_004084700 [Elysia marginata]|uniref:Uncharacterized protein n=1 Tax=Elysia marginata TaxID=1093978 RepID=A0AAV4G9M8_9GAST|nr:hypothetical protein ElyMa_004084700 [Elysia marginata]